MKYKIFGKTGVRASEIVLGTGNFGTGWGHGASESESQAILGAYADAGGNFIDTADIYQFGQSEEIIGGALRSRRDEFFLATKFTSGASPTPNRLTTGNSRLAMIASVEASLRRLKTDRIDLLWVHHPDGLTSSEEIVRGLDDLARAGKIIYAGLSNFPAWRLSRVVTLAELSDAVPIAAAQFEYSLANRKAEAELLPACEALGIAPVTWSPLGGGMLTGKYRSGEVGRAEAFGGKVFQAENSQQRSRTLDAVLEISQELGCSPDQVAIAWVRSQGTFLAIGPRTIAHVQSNLASLAVRLSESQLAKLSQASSSTAEADAEPGATVDLSDTDIPLTRIA